MEYLDDEERIMFEGLDKAIESRPFGAEQADWKIFEQITLAIRKKRALKFPYKKPGTKTYEMREVLPYRLLKTNHRWYLIGPYVGSVEATAEFLKKPFPYHKLMRKFALSRMREPELLPIKFTVPANFSLSEYLEGAFIIKTGTGDYNVEIETNAYLTDVLGDRHLHKSQKWTHNEDGSALLSMRLNCLDEIEEFVLSYGTDLMVRGPQELRDRIYQKAMAVERIYRPQSNTENLNIGIAEIKQPTIPPSPQSVVQSPQSPGAGASAIGG
jgi:predicted DNA-binding transcriptional regulator YafY